MPLLSRDAWDTEFSNQQIGFDVVLIGRHCTPDHFAQRLRSCFTNTHGLASSIKAFTFEEPNSPTSKPDHVTVHIRSSEEIASVDVAGLRVDVVVQAPVDASYGVRGDELTVKPETVVYIAFPETVALSQASQVWDDLELFWGLMTGDRADLVAGFASQHEGAGEARHDEITEAFLGVVQPDATNGESMGDLFYDLTRGDHAGTLSGVLQAWMERRDGLRLSARLLIDTWSKKLSWESKLGIIAQAVEAFHRTSRHQQAFIASAQYDQIEQGLRTKISELTSDEDLRTSLKKRVEFGNQVSLRRRTKDLMRAMPRGLRDSFGKWQTLADNMVLARNAIIHRDPRSPPPSFRETVRVTGHFQLTVHVALLQALGVPDDVIAHRVQMQSPYQRWLSYRR